MNDALITGASSGIGYELAKLFAKKGNDVILVARNKEKLARLADDLENTYSINAHTIDIDLGHPDAADEIIEQVQGKSLAVTYLVNNAGLFIKGPFTGTNWTEEQKLILMQCLNHTRLTKLILPGMLERGKGGILNVGSTGSFVPGPYNAVYCAAKSFVLSFSEALAEEAAGSGVTVTALCPGGTNTAFQDLNNRRGAFFSPVMDPAKVAETGFNALMNGKRLVVPGMANKMQVFMVRFLPRYLVARISACLSSK